MIDTKYYSVDKDQQLSSDFWTVQLYKSAYELIDEKDRFPIVIPSYNRPDCLFLEWVHSTLQNSGETWPIYLMVRDSQVDMYKNASMIKGYDFIHVISRPDEEIDDVGKARKAILSYFFDKTDWVFMLDDDVFEVGFTVPIARKNSLASGIVKNTNFARVFAMWQRAIQVAQKYRPDDLFETAMYVNSFAWMPECCDPSRSVCYGKGTTGVCTAINIKFAKNHGLNFNTIKGNGHDDANFVIRCLLNGGIAAFFSWLVFRCDNGFNDKSKHEVFSDEDMVARFKRQQTELRSIFHDCPFLKCTAAKSNKYDVVNIDWRKAVKYHNENFKDYPPLDYKKRLFDLSEEMIYGKT